MPEAESAEQKAEDDMYASFNMTIMIERSSDGKVVKLAKVRGRNETEGTAEEKKKRCTGTVTNTHTPHIAHYYPPQEINWKDCYGGQHDACLPHAFSAASFGVLDSSGEQMIEPRFDLADDAFVPVELAVIMTVLHDATSPEIEEFGLRFYTGGSNNFMPSDTAVLSTVARLKWE